MTDDQLRAIRERAEAATMGPWFPHDYTGLGGEVTVSCDHPAEITVAAMGRALTAEVEEQHANAAFIASARTGVPALLEEVARLKALLQEVRGPICAAIGRMADDREPAITRRNLEIALVRIRAALAGDAEKGPACTGPGGNCA